MHGTVRVSNSSFDQAANIACPRRNGDGDDDAKEIDTMAMVPIRGFPRASRGRSRNRMGCGVGACFLIVGGQAGRQAGSGQCAGGVKMVGAYLDIVLGHFCGCGKKGYIVDIRRKVRRSRGGEIKFTEEDRTKDEDKWRTPGEEKIRVVLVGGG